MLILQSLKQHFSKPLGHRAVANGNSASAQPKSAKADSLSLTQKPAVVNPYEGTAPGHAKVKVDIWGEGDNGSLTQILNNQGYNSQELYKKDASGKTLVDRVAQQNGLKNPNLVRPGQELSVPSKIENLATEAPATPDEPKAPAAAEPQAPATPQAKDNKPAVNSVKVDKWGQGENDSLGAILKNQGFTHQEIFQKDSKGDSLLDKVARANKLSSPDQIQAGATLQIPNSKEALAQMNIPAPQQKAAAEQPAEVKPAPVEVKPEPVEVKPEPVAVEPTPTPQPAPAPTPSPQPDVKGEATANMGMLLDGVKSGNFKRDEFQFLNAFSNRYAEKRVSYAKDGYTDSELQSLGSMERAYGTQFARLHASDDIVLKNVTSNSADPKAQVRIRHYQEGGRLWDAYSQGHVDSESALRTMMRQRAEARELGTN